MAAGGASPVRVIVTGERGAGKTTLCRGAAAAARPADGDGGVAGILSPAVFAGGAKMAIDAEDLRTGERRRLARRRALGEACPEGETATEEWVFDAATLRWGAGVLAAATPCRLLVVDEVGPLEFERAAGWAAGLAAVDGGRFDLALVVVRPRLLEAARRRWGEAEVVFAPGPGSAAAGAALVARILGGGLR